MKFTQIRNKVKMQLKELNMLILQFVVIIFYNIYSFYCKLLNKIFFSFLLCAYYY